jgi:8-amino-3,8-dideoxy-alpha-D-manno-octulosonate transaminase
MHENKKRLKDSISDIEGITFREILDPEGECASLLVFFMPTAEAASALAQQLGTTTIAQSGWHVYNNMEQILGKMTVTKENCPFSCPYYTNKGGDVQYSKGMLPQTDDLINRAINISIGVVDAGLGSKYGINIKSTPEEIDEVAANLRQAITDCLQ